MKATGKFARELEGVANELGDVILERYAKRLSAAISAFDMSTSESMLKQFPHYAAAHIDEAALEALIK